MSHLKPFQLLEINVISAQDLHCVSKNMRTYATAWVHPKRKLSTSIDAHGHNNPTWNDKFVFRVDDEFLRLDTSAVVIEIYAPRWFCNTLVGTVRVLVGNLIPPPTRPNLHHHHHHVGMRFAALQVRRPSGRPQGILNIGVTVLDSSMRSMPLYTQPASAVGCRNLMEEDHNDGNNNNNNSNAPVLKPILRRSRSERSERFPFDDLSSVSGSIIAITQKKGVPGKASSLLSGGSESTIAPKGKVKKGKASSMISGAELREKPNEKGKKSRASSLINGSIMSKDSHKEKKTNVKKIKKQPSSPKSKVSDEEHYNAKPPPPPPPMKNNGVGVAVPTKEAVVVTTTGKAISKFNGYEFGGPKGSSIVNGKYTYNGAPPKAPSLWSDSEVGPSPSEVAAAMARERYLMDDNQSSVLDGWSLDESVEGLRSKLERWRTELPPLYDRGGLGSSSFRSTSQHIWRHTADDAGSGLFSCFGNIYGYECQCICGKPRGKEKP